MTEFNHEGRGFLSVDLTGVAAITGGAVLSLANPFGSSVFILRAWIYYITPSTGAANINVGVGATATTDANDIISAMDAVAGGTAKLYCAYAPQATAETEVAIPVVWSSAKYITATGSATTVGLSARLYLEYLRV